MNDIALFISPSKKSAAAAVKVASILRQKGCSVYVPDETTALPDETTERITCEELKNKCGMIISLGGDGTFLKAASAAIGCDTLLFGFNLGTLGFLAEAPIENCEAIIEKIINEEYEVKEKMALECVIKKGGETVFRGNALNEIAIYRGTEAKLLNLSFHISGVYGGTYRADGLVVSSPTGSTAYSLSAGGPIISPDVECLLLTALCPHTLSARPLVVSPADLIMVSEEQAKSMSVSLDGHLDHIAQGEHNIFVGKAAKGLKTVSLGNDFYTIVREKLRWVI